MGSCFLLLVVPISPQKRKLDEESLQFYLYAGLFMSGEEIRLFRKLPTAEDRQLFIKYFWKRRDPTPETDDNEFKEEIENRFEYVQKYLKEGSVPGRKTDRGRIYLQLGPPNQINSSSWQVGKPNWISWSYHIGFGIIGVTFIDTEGFGVYRMDMRNTSFRLLNVLEKRRHFIHNEKKSVFDMKIVKIKTIYDPSSEELLIRLPLKDIHFLETESQKHIQLKVDLMIYQKNDIIFNMSQQKKIDIDESVVTQSKPAVTIAIPVSIPKGKHDIYTVVRDTLGHAVGSQFKSIKVK